MIEKLKDVEEMIVVGQGQNCTTNLYENIYSEIKRKPNTDEIIAKINEIIDKLNGEENELIEFDGSEFIKDNKGNLHIVTGGVISKDEINNLLKKYENEHFIPKVEIQKLLEVTNE